MAVDPKLEIASPSSAMLREVYAAGLNTAMLRLSPTVLLSMTTVSRLEDSSSPSDASGITNSTPIVGFFLSES